MLKTNEEREIERQRVRMGSIQWVVFFFFFFSFSKYYMSPPVAELALRWGGGGVTEMLHMVSHMRRRFSPFWIELPSRRLWQ